MTGRGNNAGSLFSIVIPAYNRATEAMECVASCVAQDRDDFEVILVDDGSSDGTGKLVESAFPTVRVLYHEHNRGISSARQTGTAAARGEWLLFLDSDGALLPGALARLSEIIAHLDPGVGEIRAQLLSDDNSTPSPVSASSLGRMSYNDIVRFMANSDRADLVSSIRSDVLDESPFLDGRRGPMELLEVLNRARCTDNLIVDDVVFRHRTDTHNSTLRSTDLHEVPARLLAEAPDMAWMAETVAEQHGAALREFGPELWRAVLKIIVTQKFVQGDRRGGTRAFVRAFRSGCHDLETCITFPLGLIGPRAVVYGSLFRRMLAARKPHY